MGCKDCDTQIQEGSVPIQKPVVFPQGYTGCTLGTLAQALPSELLGAPYPLPRITESGDIIYAQRDVALKPPPDIDGYVRDQDDPWRFHPLWTECVMRIHGTRRNRSTGAINVVMICNHPQCAYRGGRIAYTDCNTCPHRMEPI